jgi:hypothetical protein
MRNLILLFALLTAAAHVHGQATCNTPIVITAGTYTVAAVNGSEIPTPICAENGAGNTSAGMWYSYTATADLMITVTTDLPQNGNTDTRVHVYTGPCGNRVCIAGDDDGGTGFTSLVSWSATAGTSYRIAFDNRWTSAGFQFRLIEGTEPPPPPALLSFTNVPVSTSGSDRAVVDMNGDYLDDVVSVTSTNVRIARQQPGGSFSVVNIPTPPAVHAPSWSMAVGDIDGNGQMDLLYGGGEGVTFMYANNDGTGFTQVTGPQYVFSQRSNFVDINNDGHLDAFVCHDVQPNVYYLNDGNGNLTFHQGGLGDTPDGGNYGSIWIDYDSDGDLDLFIAKCRGGTTPANINQLHRNNGDGTFTEVAAQVGLADNIQTWSAAWGDFDNDGHKDVIVGASSFINGGHKVMRNNGTTFVDVTAGSGWDTFASTSIEHTAHDFNNDGYLDVLAGGGVIMLGNGDFTFTPVNTGVSAGGVGDLNNDGFLDILNGSTIRMNVPNGRNWLKVNTIGVISNSNGIGARVTVTSALGTQMRDVKSGDGFRHMSSLTAHFGVRFDEVIDEVVVYWPSGLVSVVPNPPVNTTLNIIESISTGIAAEAAPEELRVFPNPVTDVLRVEGSAITDRRHAFILDLGGRLVQEGALLNGTIDVTKLAPGTYVLQVNADGKVISRKFSKH